MNILNLLSDLASVTPNNQGIDHIIKDQSSQIQDAIKSNNGEELKKLMSQNQFYANETLVTLY